MHIVELHFQDRALPFEHTHLVSLLFVSQQPKSKAALSIPRSDDEIFWRLYSFITTGDYAPIEDQRPTERPSMNTSPGPPRIADYKATEEPLMLVDIKYTALR